MRIHEAEPGELRDWDDRTVRVPGGDVAQSATWAAYRSRWGWTPRFLVFDDGFRLLSLERPWPVVGGSGAYLSRGPVSAGEGPERTADRLDAAAAYLAGRGVDVVSSDAAIEASTGYPALLVSRGFRRIEEIQPARHTMLLDLPAGDPDAALAAISKQTRQRIRSAESGGLVVVRYDLGGPPSDGGTIEPPEPPRADDPARTAPAFDRLYALLVGAAERRGFGLRPRAQFVDWSTHALAAGHLLLLEARLGGPDGELVAALSLHRHGGRLATALSADRAELRREHPGALHLLRWRAIQLAIREGCAALDLGGVDVRGARRIPVQGESTFGLYEHKRSYGARWVELSGNHERVVRPWRYALGRLTGRLARSR